MRNASSSRNGPKPAGSSSPGRASLRRKAEQGATGKADFAVNRAVSIEDLLPRDPIQLETEELHRWINGRVILVTGSAGSIGSEICRQLLRFHPKRLVAVDRSENGQFYLQSQFSDAAAQTSSAHQTETAPPTETVVTIGDLCDAGRMRTLFEQYQPEIVFHAAAYKHVPLMESNAGEAAKNIALGTQQLADLAEATEVGSFVLVSTDKAVHPTSVMGCCKRVAELYVQSLAQRSECRFSIVRFGNVLDSAGSVVPVFREQIAQGGPVTVTHPDMQRYFMTIPEASQLVVQAGAMGRGGEIFVLDMGRPVRIVDLAKDMIRLSGLRPGRDVEIVFTGVRPGEKLQERLLLADEQHRPTRHPKILAASPRPVSKEEMRYGLEQLRLVVDAPREVVMEELQRLVPQYQPPAAIARMHLESQAA